MGSFFWVFGGGGEDFCEKHSAGSGLVKSDKLNFDFLAKFLAGVIDDNHGAVTEIGDALVWIATGGDDFNFSVFAGEILVA